MKDRGLAVTENDALIPNVGAQLLFAADASKQIASAQIHVALEGPPEWVATVAGQDAEKQARFVLEGNLWTQLDAASAFLSRANKPFRLKGTTSLDVYPYPPLALKELLTNLIAHRDYSINEPSTIHVTPTRITFSNPGGLIDHVRKQLRDESIFNAIRESQRGIKGYRNPVVADFFYAAGAMDKKGSGLPDVLDESANNLNDVTFGPSSDNHSFHAAIGAQPEVEQVDHITRTAKVMQRELEVLTQSSHSGAVAGIYMETGHDCPGTRIHGRAHGQCTSLWGFRQLDTYFLRPSFERCSAPDGVGPCRGNTSGTNHFGAIRTLCHRSHCPTAEFRFAETS